MAYNSFLIICAFSFGKEYFLPGILMGGGAGGAFLLFLFLILIASVVFLILKNKKRKSETAKKIEQLEEETVKLDVYKATVEKSLNSFFTVTPDGGIKEYNKSFLEKFEIDEQNNLPRNLEDLNIPGHFYSYLEVAAQKKETVSIEITLPVRDRTKSFSVIIIPFFTKGKLTEYAVVGTEITNYKETLRKLEQSENKFRTIYEKASDPIFLIKGTIIIDCNHKAEDFFGYSREELLNQDITNLSLSENGQNSIEDRVRNYIDAAYSGIPQAVEWNYQTKNGASLYTEVHLNKITLRSEEFLIAIIRDMSGFKESEKIQKALLEISEASRTAEDLKALYSIIHVTISRLMHAENFYLALYEKDNGTISFPYFIDEHDEAPSTREFGRGITEYVLRTSRPLLADEEDLLELEKKGEIELIGSDSVDWLGVPLILKGETIGVVVVQNYDGTKKYTSREKDILTFVSSQIAMAISAKRAENELRENANELSELNSTKDKLFSIIAHDLKSPFTALLGYTELIVEDFDNLDKAQLKEFTASVHQIGKNVHSLLENLLDWSRMQAGSITYEPEELNIKFVAADVVNLFKYHALNKNISIENKIDRDLFARCDYNMVTAALRNLISNAVKFTARNGAIVLSGKELEDSVQITVSDDGVGMSAEEIEALLSSGHRASRYGTNNEKGTGLGLLLVKEFVEMNNGALEIESKKGSGSSFSFTLPQA